MPGAEYRSAVIRRSVQSWKRMWSNKAVNGLELIEDTWTTFHTGVSGKRSQGESNEELPVTLLLMFGFFYLQWAVSSKKKGDFGDHFSKWSCASRGCDVPAHFVHMDTKIIGRYTSRRRNLHSIVYDVFVPSLRRDGFGDHFKKWNDHVILWLCLFIQK